MKIYADVGRLPIKSWCLKVEPGAWQQAVNLANHPVVFRHVALMPDCHVGFGMPIGGVIATEDAIIPNAVGVDIGCGMGAVQTSCPAKGLREEQIREILSEIKRNLPVGEGHAHRLPQEWVAFEKLGRWPGGIDSHGWDLAYRNLGTLGGGNHFVELQKGDDGWLWLMIHSGSRNLGLRIAEHYHQLALQMNSRDKIPLPDGELAFLPIDTEEGQGYIADMNFALEYARENRRRIMAVVKAALLHHVKGVEFLREINIHHNYAALERHFGREVWVHRKGATSAKEGEMGIIPGSMGTPSFIVRGLGAPESFQSCSHGAGRVMGRMEACRRLSREECDKAMAGIVFDGWKPSSGGGKHRKVRGLLDLEEAPQAYKDIDEVMDSQLDLVAPVVKLWPLGVIKG